METSTAFLAMLWAACLSRFLQRNLRCSGKAAAYLARGPTPFWCAMAGCIAIGSLNAAVEPLVRFYYPCTKTKECAVPCAWLKKGFSWRGQKKFFPIPRLWRSTHSHISGNQGYDSNRTLMWLHMSMSLTSYQHNTWTGQRERDKTNTHALTECGVLWVNY